MKLCFEIPKSGFLLYLSIWYDGWKRRKPVTIDFNCIFSCSPQSVTVATLFSAKKPPEASNSCGQTTGAGAPCFGEGRASFGILLWPDLWNRFSWTALSLFCEPIYRTIWVQRDLKEHLSSSNPTAHLQEADGEDCRATRNEVAVIGDI